ncbi:MAG: hypothetical protein LBV18_05555 [Alistipes sp.]|jgi:hypothetical protein|nr:hypothetical protein [Alistipes sp.]
MKRSLLLLLAGALLAGCQTEPKEEAVHLDLSKESIAVDCAGGETRLTLTNNNDWSSFISLEDREWLSIRSEAGEGDQSTIIVTTAANTGEEQREATVTFSSKSVTEILTVTQSALSATLSTAELPLGYKNATGSFEFTANVEQWNFSIEPADAEWLTAERVGETGVSVVAEDNYSGRTRSATVVVTAGHETFDVTVRQESFALAVSPQALQFNGDGATKTVTVTTNAEGWTFSVPTGAEWIQTQKTGDDRLSVTVGQNPLNENRSETITLEADGQIEELVVTQYQDGALNDKEVVRLQTATVGEGVTLIIMGDGYIADDMQKGGKYEEDMYAAMEHFFSVYPYSGYRDMFDVWMIGAVSNERGMSCQNPWKNVDTVFQSIWEGGGSTKIDSKDGGDTVASYVELVTGANETEKRSSEVTVIIPINENVYAGTCWMYPNGFAFGFCPVGPTYKEIVVHEMGGHGFGKLIDEYIYYSGYIPTGYKSELIEAQEEFGFYKNVSFSGDISQTLWADFEGVPGYEMVSTFEGAYMYRRGIWRAESNSCMNDNVLYFNAPSRWFQIERMHRYGGLEYSFEQFLAEDARPPYPQQTRGEGVRAPFVPLAPPVLVRR